MGYLSNPGCYPGLGVADPSGRYILWAQVLGNGHYQICGKIEKREPTTVASLPEKMKLFYKQYRLVIFGVYMICFRYRLPPCEPPDDEPPERELPPPEKPPLEPEPLLVEAPTDLEDEEPELTLLELLDVLGVKPDERFDDVDDWRIVLEDVVPLDTEEPRFTELPPVMRCEETTLLVRVPLDGVPVTDDLPLPTEPRSELFGRAVLPTVLRVLLCPRMSLLRSLPGLPWSLPKLWPLP